MLDLSYNDYLKKVPSVVGEINTLNKLSLSWCGLEDLPERLVQVYIIYKHEYIEDSITTHQYTLSTLHVQVKYRNKLVEKI